MSGIDTTVRSPLTNSTVLLWLSVHSYSRRCRSTLQASIRVPSHSLIIHLHHRPGYLNQVIHQFLNLADVQTRQILQVTPRNDHYQKLGLLQTLVLFQAHWRLDQINSRRLSPPRTRRLPLDLAQSPLSSITLMPATKLA